MVRNVKLRRMGGSVGATLPKDLADRFHLEAGDEVLVVETALGILLSPYDPDVEEALLQVPIVRRSSKVRLSSGSTFGSMWAM